MNLYKILLVEDDACCGDRNAVNVHIGRLRNKIEEAPRRGRGTEAVFFFYKMRYNSRRGKGCAAKMARGESEDDAK